MPKHLNIKITGKVQGVTFRFSAQSEARKLGITGFALNQPNGSVYIEAEGEEQKLAEFLRWCQSGPERAIVEKVAASEGHIKNFTDFTIPEDGIPNQR
jgi:acylphosphatase